MEIPLDYVWFLAKVLTVIIAVMVVVVFLKTMKKSKQEKHELHIEYLNDEINDIKQQIQAVTLTSKAFKRQEKENAKVQKKTEKESESSNSYKPITYIMDFHGDIKASATQQLRHEITAVLNVFKHGDEVVVRVESGGGMVHAYGLASAQLARLRDVGIPLTICVDKVAASGGYMMACVADCIVAAPFAAVGSIGVVAQLPNFNKVLKKNDIDVEIFTAGEYKRTVTLFGENTDKDREKFQSDLDVTYDQFKEFVAHYRPNLNIDAVATGEVWLGTMAKKIGLVDEVMTSDQWLMQKIPARDLYLLSLKAPKKSVVQKMFFSAESAVSRLIQSILWRPL